MSIYNLISEKEKSMILYCINEYADGNKTIGEEELSYILREWAHQKDTNNEVGQINLVNLLGGKLIARKRINYEMSKEEMAEKIEQEVKSYYDFKSEFNSLVEWYVEHENAYSASSELYQSFWRGRSIRALVDLDTLASGRWIYDDLSLTLGNGHTLKICRGARPLKNIKKFCDSYKDICPCAHLEQFINEMSTVRTSNRGNAELCISIHPLDYITMSDNENGWESCMSWRANGCYRLGTVEMMNSPYVVVAYVSSDKNQMGLFHYYENDHNYWNSKAWRELFIVTDDTVVGIKGYPNTNHIFATEVLKFIKELAEKNLGIYYDGTINCGYFSQQELPRSIDAFFEDGTKVNLYTSFTTEYMYNDFGRTNNDFILNKNLKPLENNADLHLIYNYSGVSECMVSGQLNFKPEFEDELVCDECSNNIHCDICHERLRDNDDYEIYYLDGLTLCEDCYNDRLYYSTFTKEEHDINNSYSVTIIPREKNITTLHEFSRYPVIRVFDGDADSDNWERTISTNVIHSISVTAHSYAGLIDIPKTVLYADEIINPEKFIMMLRDNDSVGFEDEDNITSLAEMLGVEII